MLSLQFPCHKRFAWWRMAELMQWWCHEDDCLLQKSSFSISFKLVLKWTGNRNGIDQQQEWQYLPQLEEQFKCIYTPLFYFYVFFWIVLLNRSSFVVNRSFCRVRFITGTAALHLFDIVSWNFDRYTRNAFTRYFPQNMIFEKTCFILQMQSLYSTAS